MSQQQSVGTRLAAAVPYASYVQILRRRWWVVPLVALAAALGALMFAWAQAPVYRSTATLVVTPGRPDLGQQITVEKQLRPMAQRVKTTETARHVDQDERLDLGAERLLEKVRAEAVIDQGLLRIDADDVNPRRAERIAGGFAQHFAQQHASADVGKPQAERLNVDVLDRPTAATQVHPRTQVLVLAAFVIGLLGGLLLASLLEYLDNTLKTGADVEQVLGLSTLGRIPREQPPGRPSHQPEIAPAGLPGKQHGG